MAWRPKVNLLDGELSNRVPGKVTGWMRFFRRQRQPLRVVFDLEGDFHEDIRGSDVVIKNDDATERDGSFGRYKTYMEGFDPMQRGTVGNMTAGLPLGPWTEELAERLKAQLEIIWRLNGRKGTELKERRRAVAMDYAAKIAAGELYYPYIDYPYLEWYSDNGRVVLELQPEQITVMRPETPPTEKSPKELVHDRKKRAKASGSLFLGIDERSFHQENHGRLPISSSDEDDRGASRPGGCAASSLNLCQVTAFAKFWHPGSRCGITPAQQGP